MTLGAWVVFDRGMASRTHLHRLASAAVIAAIGTSLIGCGSDDDTSSTDAARAYCASVADIETFAGGLFAELGDDASIEEQLAAEGNVAEYIRDQGYDRQDLPDEIADDWAAFWDGFTTKLEPGNPQPTDEQMVAEERLLAWEAENCGA
jgi:hypothetical protein